MRLTELLFSFKGRIQRLYWWVATIAVGAAAGAITGILEVAAKASGHSVVNPDTQQFEATGLFGIVVLLVGLVNLWINFALSVKRLHDRGRSGWWLVWQTLILAVAAVLVVVAIAVPKEQAPVWWVLASVVGVVALAVSIWLFVEIGCLRGTQGPNRFGEDPLGATSAGATMTATILQPEPGRPVERQSRGGTLDESSLLVSLLGGVNSLFSLWLFVQCGLLKGTLGLNRFGPDPLGRQADASI